MLPRAGGTPKSISSLAPNGPHSPGCTLARPMEEGPCASWGIPYCSRRSIAQRAGGLPGTGDRASGPSPGGRSQRGLASPRGKGGRGLLGSLPYACGGCERVTFDVAARLARPWPASPDARSSLSPPRGEKEPRHHTCRDTESYPRSRRTDPPSWKLRVNSRDEKRSALLRLIRRRFG